MSVSTAAPRRATTPLLIAFIDLTGFTRASRRFDDEVLASALDEFYGLVHSTASGSGGRVVKNIGDGALVTWPTDRADDALAAMLALREGTAAWAGRSGIDTSALVRMHSADVVAGMFGPPEDERFDVIGREMFIAVRLEARTLSVSAEFFRRLSPGARRMLKKHSPPVVYIPAGDQRP